MTLVFAKNNLFLKKYYEYHFLYIVNMLYSFSQVSVVASPFGKWILKQHRCLVFSSFLQIILDTHWHVCTFHFVSTLYTDKQCDIKNNIWCRMLVCLIQIIISWCMFWKHIYLYVLSFCIHHLYKLNACVHNCCEPHFHPSAKSGCASLRLSCCH